MLLAVLLLLLLGLGLTHFAIALLHRAQHGRVAFVFLVHVQGILHLVFEHVQSFVLLHFLFDYFLPQFLLLFGVDYFAGRLLRDVVRHVPISHNGLVIFVVSEHFVVDTIEGQVEILDLVPKGLVPV